MVKISKKSIIIFIASMILGMSFLIPGLWVLFRPRPGSAYAHELADAVYLYIPIGVTIILLTVIGGIFGYFIKKKGIIISSDSKIFSITALLFGSALIIYGNGVLNYPPWRMVGWQVAGPIEIFIGVTINILVTVIGIYFYIISNKEQG